MSTPSHDEQIPGATSDRNDQHQQPASGNLEAGGMDSAAPAPAGHGQQATPPPPPPPAAPQEHVAMHAPPAPPATPAIPPAGPQSPAAPPAPAQSGAQYGPRNMPGRRSPVLAGFLSILPGLGHLYLGYVRGGLMIAAIYAGIISILSSGSAGGLEPFFGIGLPFLMFYAIIDAVRRANAYNLALAGMQSPDAAAAMAAARPSLSIEMPGTHGSVAGGVLILAFGFLLLLNTLFGMSLRWLTDWWPLLLIGLGIYLLREGARQRRRG